MEGWCLPPLSRTTRGRTAAEANRPPAHHPSRPRALWIVQTPSLPMASDQSRTPQRSLIRPGCLNGHRPNGVRLPPFLGPVLHPAELFNLRPAQGRRARIPRRGDGRPHIALELAWTLHEEGWRNGRRQRPSSRANTTHPTRRTILSTLQQRDPFTIVVPKPPGQRTNPPLDPHKKISHPHSLLRAQNDIRYLLP